MAATPTVAVRAVRYARLSTAGLPAADPSIPPWPGRYVDVAGARVFVRHTPGPAGGGEPALYVHGLGGASTNWTDLAALLATRLDGEAVDLPGFGWSDPAPQRDYTPTSQARVVIELLDLLGRGPVHLFGNSMGGAVSILVAARRPDLVRTLTLVSPAVPDLRPRRGSDPVLPLLLVPGLSKLAERRLTRMAPKARARAVLELCFGDPAAVPANRFAEAAAEVSRRNELPWAMDAFTRALRGLVVSHLHRGPRSTWQLAGRISAPTLLVWGHLDRLVDVGLAPRLTLAIPDARLLVLTGVGHTAQLEAPEPVARAFLALREDAAEARR